MLQLDRTRHRHWRRRGRGGGRVSKLVVTIELLNTIAEMTGLTRASVGQLRRTSGCVCVRRTEMQSHWRSAHELGPLFRKLVARHETKLPIQPHRRPVLHYLYSVYTASPPWAHRTASYTHSDSLLVYSPSCASAVHWLMMAVTTRVSQSPSFRVSSFS